MHLVFRYAIYVVVVFAIFCGVSADKRWKLVWSDEFDGTEIDESKWSFKLGDGCSIDLCGWGNNELQWYTNTPENAYVEHGRLVLQAKREFKDSLPGVRRSYSSARLVTQGKGDWKYGRIEVRARFPEGKGVWPIIYMLPTYDKYGIWPNSGELNIAVMPKPDTMYMLAICGRTYNDFTVFKKSPTNAASMFTKDFHNFIVEWEEDKITWLVDDVVVHNFSKALVEQRNNYPFNEKFHFVLSLAIGGNVAGDPSTTLFPRRLEIDYIRLFQDL